MNRELTEEHGINAPGRPTRLQPHQTTLRPQTCSSEEGEVGDQSRDGEPQPPLSDQVYSQSPDRVLQGRENHWSRLAGSTFMTDVGRALRVESLTLDTRFLYRVLATNPRRAACTKILSLI